MSFKCVIPATLRLIQDDADSRITRWDFAPGASTGWID
jgi:beta-alanine degradation protein BauB